MGEAPHQTRQGMAEAGAMVTTVNTLVNTCRHRQSPVFLEKIYLANTVTNYSRKDCWGSKTAARPVVDSAQALQWGKGVHSSHRAKRDNEYIGLRVNTPSDRCSRSAIAGRSRCYRCYRCYREGTVWSFPARGARSPDLSAAAKICDGKTHFVGSERQ